MPKRENTYIMVKNSKNFPFLVVLLLEKWCEHFYTVYIFVWYRRMQ